MALASMLLISLPAVCEEKASVTALNNPEKIVELLRTGKLATQDVPNPHWNDKACIACHTSKATREQLNLRSSKITTLCANCHNSEHKQTINHPVDVKPSKDKLDRMPEEFKRVINEKNLNKGNMTCLTCHDVIMQCEPSRFGKKMGNPQFFRGKPQTTRTGLCYNCHDSKKYARYNLHEQVAKNGEINKQQCLMCHRTADNLEGTVSYTKMVFNEAGDLNKMCTGCHPWRPHPGGELSFGQKLPNHLVVPSDYTLSVMRKNEKKHHIALPLEPKTGRLYCGTCHNSHAKGVIKNVEMNKGAESKERLRAEKLCDYCHELN